LLCLREHAIHVFTSRLQKHQPQWNYSPPGMKGVRFYGTRTSQKIKTAHPAVTARDAWAWAVPRTDCSKLHSTNRALQP